MFIGRVKELAELMNSYKRSGFMLFNLYAPKNAGKTTLLEEFCRNKDAIFFTASDVSGRANLADFTKLVLSHYKDSEQKTFMFWSDAFKYIADRQPDSKVILVLDSFDEIADKDPVFMDMLVKSIASFLKDSNIFMILSGRKKVLTGRHAAILRNLSRSMCLEKFTLTDDVIQQLRMQSGSPEEPHDRGKMLRFREDDVILHEGIVNTEMYKIISGRAVCYLGYGTDEEYVLATLKEGQSFGEYSLLTGKPGIYTVIAYTDTLLLRIGEDEFTRFVEMNANNSIEIMKNMAKMINVLKTNIDMLREESADNHNLLQ